VAIAGTLLDLQSPPAAVWGLASAYISLDELDELGQPRTLNQIDLLAADGHDWETARATAVAVRKRLEGAGYTVQSMTGGRARHVPRQPIGQRAHAHAVRAGRAGRADELLPGDQHHHGPAWRSSSGRSES
jgi:hypothetical protein